MIATLVKQPREVLHPVLAFATAPIAAVVSTQVTARGLVAGAAALGAAAAIADGQVAVTLTGGSDGERYLVTVVAQDDAGAELESELDIAVIEGAWALPDGGAPMLSIDAFVRHVGLDEVVRATDLTGAGRIDRELLVSALSAAQALAESHLAGRYALPFVAVPPVVALAIVDLARARLYPRGAPEGVDAAAKLAWRTLERIAEGKLSLGVPEAERPAAPVSDTPVLIAPGRRAYPGGLDDY